MFTRFIDCMKEERENWTKYCGLGFFMTANKAYTEAKEHGEWKVGSICVCELVIWGVVSVVNHINHACDSSHVCVYVCVCVRGIFYTIEIET